MEIADVKTIEFTYESRTSHDEYGHTHPSDPHEATETLTRIVVDGGPDGYFFGGMQRGNQFAAETIVGRDPLEREAIWRRLHRSQRLGKETISDLELAAVDCALWDVAGRAFEQPIATLLGGSRRAIPACAYTMNGDDDPDGLGSPAAYADFASTLVERGYRAINLHGWMPPYEVDPDRDVDACRAVREAVGDDVDLLFTPYHHYDRTTVRSIGQRLQQLSFEWIEEPTDESSWSSYEWLGRKLEIPIMGAKSLDGNVRARAEWLKRDVSDAVRIHIDRLGGITPAVKVATLCDALGVPCEVSGSSAATLQVLGLSHVGQYYQRGTLHPAHDYGNRPWLASPLDPLSADGTVSLPRRPGLGYDVDWDYVEQHVQQRQSASEREE